MLHSYRTPVASKAMLSVKYVNMLNKMCKLAVPLPLLHNMLYFKSQVDVLKHKAKFACNNHHLAFPEM